MVRHLLAQACFDRVFYRLPHMILHQIITHGLQHLWNEKRAKETKEWGNQGKENIKTYKEMRVEIMKIKKKSLECWSLTQTGMNWKRSEFCCYSNEVESVTCYGHKWYPSYTAVFHWIQTILQFLEDGCAIPYPICSSSLVWLQHLCRPAQTVQLIVLHV